MPTSTTPPAVYHIHGSAAGAFPGVAASASPDGKLKVQGMVEAEVATTDEILDAFDGKPSFASGCAPCLSLHVPAANHKLFLSTMSFLNWRPYVHFNENL